MFKKIGKIILLLIAAIIICSVLFYLRMIPAIGDTVEFIYDQAFNYRMTAEVIENGDVPKIDHLSTYPEGKEIKAFLPTGMYHICALFWKVLNRFTEIPLSRAILLFCSFFGSLIFVPVYFLSYEIYRNKTIAFTTAFLAGIIPAYLQRTSCYWYRYEVFGTPLIFTSLLFFIKAFIAQTEKKTILYSILSVAFLIATLFIWRLGVLFLIVYIIVFLFIWLKEKKFQRKWRIIFFIVLGLSFLLIWFTPGFTGNNVVNNYGSFPGAAAQIIKHDIGIKQDFTEFTRVVYTTTELRRATLPDMFSAKYFSFSFIFVLFYFFAYFRKKTRTMQEKILFIFLSFFLALTFIFSRNKLLLGPLAALTLGEGMTFAFKTNKRLKGIAILLIIIMLAKTGYDSYTLVTTRQPHTKIRPNFKDALAVINEKTPKDAVILCFWSDGYPVQTYCNRPTIVDGLLESPEIIRRIVEVSEIFYSYNEDNLWAFCKKYGATHVLMPKNKKQATADFAGSKYAERYLQEGVAATNGTVLYKLIFTPEESNKFDYLYGNGEYNLYRVK